MTADPIQQRNAELVILNKVAQTLNAIADLDTLLQTVLDQTATFFNLETGWIWLLAEDDVAKHYLAAARNLPTGLDQRPEKLEGWCYCLSSFREGNLAEAANINVVQCSRLFGLEAESDYLAFHTSVPLIAHGKKIGMINLSSRDRKQLSASELQLLHTIGDMLSMAVERARLFAQQKSQGELAERNRLARELHDTVAQGLTAVTLQLESASVLLEGEAQQAEAYVEKALALTRHNLAEIRRSVLDLRAVPLMSKTLAEALTELAQPDVTVTVIGEHKPVPTRIAMGLYRIAQEALTNARQHAAADEITLDLKHHSKTIELTISDNGRGFDPEDLTAERFGLVGITERVNLLTGQLDIATAVGQGTTIQVTVPLESA